MLSCQRPLVPALLVFAVALPGLACSSGNPAPPPFGDLSQRRDGQADLWPSLDVYPPLHEARVEAGRRDDLGCALGTPDHCASCSDVCPPGKDPGGGVRVCEGGKCQLQCDGEQYDVDGKVDNGCEVKDDLPVHESASDARDLGQVSDCGDAVTATGVLPSDDRKHLQAPTDRPQGRPDWFKLHVGDDYCLVNGDVKVSLAALPAGGSYRATAYWKCDSGATLVPDAKTGSGGQTLQLAPAVSCTTIGDDSGTLFVSVEKLSGPHSDATYSVELTP